MQANCEGENYLPSLGEKLTITWMMKSSLKTALLFSLSPPPRRATIHIRGGRIGQTGQKTFRTSKGTYRVKSVKAALPYPDSSFLPLALTLGQGT